MESIENVAIKRTNENMDMLPKRLESLEAHNIQMLESIKGSCICIANGGSDAASYYASRVLARVNKIISISDFPRNILYREDLQLYRNILAITYSNNNHGIKESLFHANKNGLDTYILTANDTLTLDDVLITYSDSFDKEHSFISIASTFEPMEAMFKYYFGKFADEAVQDIYNNAAKQKREIEFNEMLPIEIMSGDNTYTASKLLNSTIIEAALGIPVVHEKDNYRHGQSTLSHHCRKNLKDNLMIYLLNGKPSELDRFLLNQIVDSYKYFIVLESKTNNPLTGEFDLAIQSMFLCKIIAEAQNKGLSKVDYNPIVKKLYDYKGKM